MSMFCALVLVFSLAEYQGCSIDCWKGRVVPLLQLNNVSPPATSAHRPVRSPTTNDISMEIARNLETSSDRPGLLIGPSLRTPRAFEATTVFINDKSSCPDVSDCDLPNSVISRPRSRAGGFAFDLKDPDGAARTPRPIPVRLTKLKSRSRSMSGDELKTHIQNKMELAKQKREVISQRANTMMVDRELRAYDVKTKADIIRREKAQRLAKKEDESNFRLELQRMEKEKKAEEKRRRREAAKMARDMKMVDEELAKLLN